MQADAAVDSQVRAVLKRFNDLVFNRDLQVLAEFAPGGEVLLIGSEAGEIASDRQELETFFKRVFSRQAAFSWEWERIEISHAGDLAWFFAEGQVILTSAGERRRAPYRVSGILQRHGQRWLWRQYHGSEPAISA
jgi:ketosteroid isomerase-like protein